ncbi:MAG: hypothetical protein NVSMB24_37960 [Mucilaginibacter sp.]
MEKLPIFKGKTIEWANYKELSDSDYLFGNALMNIANREIVEQLILDRELLKKIFIVPESINFDSYNIDLKKMNIILRVGSLPSIIAASIHASNRLLNIQDLIETELNDLYKHYKMLVELTGQAQSNTQSHSIEDAIELVKDGIMKI